MEFFVDTSFLVALHNKRDKNHAKARNFISEINGRSLFVISDYIFDEVLTVLLVRGGKLLSTQGERILEDERIHIVQIDEAVFQKAWQTYRTFKDKERTGNKKSSF